MTAPEPTPQHASTPPDPTPQELVEAALAAATGPLVVQLVERTEANLRWAANALTTNGEMRSRTVAVTALAEVAGGTAVGRVSRELADPSELAELVAAAEQAAAAGPPSPNAAALAEGGVAEDWAEPPAVTDVETLAVTARGLGAAFTAAAARGDLLYGFAEHIVTTTYLGASTGLRRRGVQPTGRLELNGKSGDLARSAWVGATTRDFTDVDVADLDAQLVTRLGWAQRRVDLPPGRYETLLPPGAVADLVLYAFWTMNDRDAREGRNVYGAGGGATRVGEQLSPHPLTLVTDPCYPGLETPPFVTEPDGPDGTSFVFDLGTAVEPVHWLSDGVLTELVRNRAQAAATGTLATPPADNLVLLGAPGGRTLEQMVAGTERGLLLTCLWYLREVDPERLLLTGITRDGVYLVEDGQVVAAVNNFRFNESPVELLGRVSEVGVTEIALCREWNDWVTRTAMPPLRVPDFTMSTVSQAF